MDRPVNFTTGPDGAIYVCDIYRRWIDHARFFPEEFAEAHDMRQGENEPPGGCAEGARRLTAKVQKCPCHYRSWLGRCAARVRLPAPPSGTWRTSANQMFSVLILPRTPTILDG